jgi:hypothetical protein
MRQGRRRVSGFREATIAQLISSHDDLQSLHGLRLLDLVLLDHLRLDRSMEYSATPRMSPVTIPMAMLSYIAPIATPSAMPIATHALTGLNSADRRRSPPIAGLLSKVELQ